MTKINKIGKTCCFYVSDWHLITMLLPNLIDKINKGIKITTIAEKDFGVKIGVLLKKLNIENKHKIEEINWNKNEIKDIDEIRRKVNLNNCIIVIGSNEYINIVNKIIEEKLDKEIKIINCYNIENLKEEIIRIIENHQNILNTSGEKKKEEIILRSKV